MPPRFGMDLDERGADPPVDWERVGTSPPPCPAGSTSTRPLRGEGVAGAGAAAGCPACRFDAHGPRPRPQQRHRGQLERFRAVSSFLPRRAIELCARPASRAARHPRHRAGRPPPVPLRDRTGHGGCCRWCWLASSKNCRPAPPPRFRRQAGQRLAVSGAGARAGVGARAGRDRRALRRPACALPRHDQALGRWSGHAWRGARRGTACKPGPADLMESPSGSSLAAPDWRTPAGRGDLEARSQRLARGAFDRGRGPRPTRPGWPAAVRACPGGGSAKRGGLLSAVDTAGCLGSGSLGRARGHGTLDAGVSLQSIARCAA